jgi:hypothetical protein
MLLHVAKEWGVQPSSVMDWGQAETMHAMAYLHHMAQLRKPPEE